MYTDYLLSFGFTQTQKSDGLSVHVSAHWTLGQLQSDVLQVYFGFAEDESLPGPQELTTLASDAKSPVNLTVPLLGKQVMLKMWLAPRLLDSEQIPDPIMPDTEDDDHEWDSYAGSAFAAISYTSDAISTPIATISAITPHPKTLQAANHFDVTCSASGGMIDDFNLFPTENGVDLEQLENKHGVFQQRSSPGDHFLFKAQAHNQDGWGLWCTPVAATATDNSHSVAAFMTGSGVNLKPPVLLKHYVTLGNSSSMRAMLGI